MYHHWEESADFRSILTYPLYFGSPIPISCVKQPVSKRHPYVGRYAAVTGLAVTHMKHIVEAPGDDGVVVERHIQRDEAAGHANATQVGGDLVPHPDGSLSQPLAHRQFQVEHRDAQNEQHDEKRYQESACETRKIRTKCIRKLSLRC